MTPKVSFTTPAKNAPIEKTKEGEIFKLFTAYEHDRRIKSNGSLLAGTHVTTETDAMTVRSGKQAVSRYSLPNHKPASYLFTVKPHKDTAIQRGIVEPTDHQPGGGQEVVFAEDTQPGTVTGPEKIADE